MTQQACKQQVHEIRLSVDANVNAVVEPSGCVH